MAALLLIGCAGERKAGPSRSAIRAARAAAAKRRAAAPTAQAGLKFRVEETRAARKAAARAPAAVAVRLSAAEARVVLRRLRPPTERPADRKAFALRGRSLPPPRTGKTVKDVFPPPQQPPVPVAKTPGPLRILRAGPEGDVNLAPNLSVTFSQPMVAVTSHDDTITGGVPVKITPAVAGRWRWVGTRTLLFEPKKRFPMATELTAEIPEGTKSALGGRLAKVKRWVFRTPPPRLLGRYPTGGPHRLDPVFFLSFDQAIKPSAVLERIALEGGGRTVAVVPATAEDIASDPQAKALAKGVMAGRWVAFRAREILPADTTFTVTVGEGTPSAEGPRTTTKAQKFTFRTYSPLRIRWQNCKDGRPCRPLSSFSLRFNNPLDEAAIDPKRIRVEPPLKGQRVQIRYNRIVIYGASLGRTTYRVTIPADVTDKFGQTLGSEEVRTFHTREARPVLFSPGGRHRVLDPSGDKSFSVYTINHDELDVQVRAVEPSDWRAFLSFASRGMRAKEPEEPPGKLRFRRTIAVKGKADTITETRIPLGEALVGGHGQVVVLVTEKPLHEKPWQRQVVTAWLQVTDLAVDAFVDDRELLAWVTRLRDGRPVAGARVRLGPDGATATSDPGGLAKLPLPETSGTSSRVVVASIGQDQAMLPETSYYWRRSSAWRRRKEGPQLRWFVFDDRKLYRPKETVRVKGWIRLVDMSRTGGIIPLPEAVRSVSYRVSDSRRNKIAEGTASLGGLGGFDLRFALPDTANLGRARVELSVSGSSAAGARHWHSFKIQEFRRPEFEVTSNVSGGPHLVGGSAVVSASASYYAGGGLPNADVRWRVVTRDGYFSPPNRSDYSFGGSRPSWWRRPRSQTGRTKQLEGKTDSRGKHRIRIHFDSVDPARPQSVRAEATIIDVNRQTWTTTSNLLVHPARHYVGLRTRRYFVERGRPLRVNTIVADLDGKLVSGRPVTVRAVRTEYRYQRGKWRQREADPQSCKVTSGAAPVTCTFETKKGGTYVIEARVKDGDGRPNRTVITRWVSGGFLPPKRKVERERVLLIADRKTYQPGDTAEILVQAPFSPSEGLLTLRRSGILEVRRFRIQGGSTTLRVPIREEYLPNLHVQVDLAGAAPRLDDQGKANPKVPKRPALASGSLNLSIPPLKRKLALEVRPERKETEPGARVKIALRLRDAAGKPVAAGEVAVVVVDEAILALTGYRIGDPLGTFYPYRGDGTSDHYLRPQVVLASLSDLLKKAASSSPDDAVQRVMEGARATGAIPPPSPAPASVAMAKKAMRKGNGGGGEAAAQPIAVRADFRALAYFAPAVRTDAEGGAQVAFKLPDNLTRYRVMAVAVAGRRFYGKGESTVKARLPLMVRPSAPRFLNFGDRFELPVVIQNQTSEPMRVEVAVRGTNIRLTAGRGRRLTVPAYDRREVRFPAAADDVGTARFQIGAVSGRWSDAAEVSLPVWTPATTEAFATYGTLDKGAMVQPVQAPAGVFKQFGGLEVTTSSTALQALTDAVLYLTSYPFECSEQISSRVLAVAALKDVLKAFAAPGLPSPEKMLAAVNRDLKKLRGMQNSDGGFAFWRRGYRSWPFLSCHVTHALVRARAKGFPVPVVMLQRALRHLKEIERYIPSTYGPRARRAVQSYAVYVRALSGDKDVAKARRLFREMTRSKEPPLEGVAWLYPVLSGADDAKDDVAAIRTLLRNRVTETAATAHFVTSYGDQAYLLLHSNRRIDALLLEGLIQDQPKSDLIAKIVRGLLAHRKRGRWGSTQENAWVLLSLDRYFRTYEKATPNFVARAWLGDRYAGGHAFRGRTTERHYVEIPMRLLAASQDPQRLILAKGGPGRLYYRIGMRYAPRDLKPPPTSHGFTVRRTYEAVDDPKDVRRDKDGTWRFRAGARVRVRLTLVAPTRRYHVALVDPLPAGLEPVNTALRGQQSAPPDKKSQRSVGRHWWRRWWQPTWFEHQNLRDERAEAFSSLLWAGVHTYRYVARATTPGVFVVPPPKAEEMYHPETFGRGAGDKVVVE